MLIKDAARKAAGEVLRAYWHEGRFPVDPFEVARRMGIASYRVALQEDVSGMVVANSVDEAGTVEATILVDHTHTPHRQSFTCAHELGHYAERVLTSKQGMSTFAFVDKRTSKSDAHEFYANEFAGNLLMPENEVHRLLQSPTGASAAELARYFNVSVPAMDVRLRRLTEAQSV